MSLGKNQVANLNTTLYGTLNNLNVSNLTLSTTRQTIVDGNINFKNLFSKSSGDFEMDAKFNKLSSNYKDLKALLPNVLGKSLPSSLDNLKNFSITGTSNISSDEIKANINITSELGLIFTDLSIKNVQNIDEASYKGKVIFDEFDIGEFTNDEKLGALSLNVDVDGKGFSLEKLNTHINGFIYGIDYNNYYYSDVAISGNIQNKVFNGQVITKDSNIDLEFDGLIDFSKQENQYDFTANVKKANLKALNFVTKDSISFFSGNVSMDMKGTNYDDAYGNISFKNTLYKNENDEYYFKDFSVSSRFVDDIRFLDVDSPDIIEGSLNGKFVVADVVKLIENALGNIYTNYQAHDLKEKPIYRF